MDNIAQVAPHGLQLPILKQAPVRTVGDQVFDALQQRILSLELPPTTKISESEVATQMRVSRQPVREAFKRLARLGFLVIRPQSSTTVSLISERAVRRARYIRAALEVQTIRTACETVTPAGLAILNDLIQEQTESVKDEDRHRFHTLDGLFHKEICDQAGVGYVWDMIQQHKAHMDRMCMLTLDASSQRMALAEHIVIYDAVAAGAGDRASAAMSTHLSRILDLIEVIKSEDHTWFTDETP